jgi:hypothetical protein
MTGWPVSFAAQTITRLRAPLVGDRYDNQVRDWPNADRLDITPCVVEPVAAPELNDGTARDAVARRWFVSGPPGADVTAVDRVEFGGVTYAVDGEPLQFAVGVLGHCELWLADVRG